MSQHQHAAQITYHQINDLTLCCRRRGGHDEPAIVCLHGLLDNGASFDPLIDALAPRLATSAYWLAPDWRGHGDSAWAPGGYVFSNYLADLDALLDTLAPGRTVILIGHSMGGQAASLYAGVRPERIAGLILLDTLNVPESDPNAAGERYRDWLDTCHAPPTPRRYADPEAFTARLARRYPELGRAATTELAELWLRRDGDGYRLAADPAHLRKSPYGFRADEAMAIWAEIAAPVLMIDGAASPAKWFIDEATRAERRSVLADLEHVELDGLGHMLHWQAPGRVAEPIADFIATRRLLA